MEWPDWNNLALTDQRYLPFVVAAATLMLVAAALLARRRGKLVVVVAGSVRLVAVIALGLAIARPVVTAQTESTFRPGGTWHLVLPGAREPDTNDPQYHESPEVFASRVRNALTGDSPPARTEIWGVDREETLAARDLIQALGVSCTPHSQSGQTDARHSVLIGIDAPRQVQPGEPLTARFRQAGPAASLKAYLDGTELPLVNGAAELRSDVAGRHVLESVLLDQAGNELQRIGHVFRVAEKPRVLAVGLPRDEFKRAARLAPEMEFVQTTPGDFSEGGLQLNGRPVELVLLSVDALNRLNSDQCFSLASFVARGGGLFVTGDGAKYVAPEYLTTDARNLLPVILEKEGKKPPPDEPKVEEEIVKAEVAKVSMCFVLDRSYSMAANIGTSRKTRWKVASKGVVESIKLIEVGGRRDSDSRHSESYATRIGVMGFTLKQQWVYELNNVFPHERNEIEKALDRMGTELTQIDESDVDAQYYNTDIYAAMETAIGAMKEEKSAVKVIVLLTDGADRDQNTLDGKKHADLRADAIAHEINIVTVGIGTEFDGSTPRSRAASQVLTDLATRTEYKHIASSPAAAEKADVIFVDSVELAFQAYDDKKKREDEERKRRLEEQKNKDLEPAVIDVMPGVFPLVLGPVGEQLFGPDALPAESPKLAWVARNHARDGAAVALGAATTEPGATPVLAFQGYGLGRVGFWGAGTDPEALGELTGWGDFPAIFAAALRWLTPREEPDVRLLAEASPEGIRILDPLEEANYLLRTGEGDTPLELKNGVLVGPVGLPLGAGEVIESIPGDELLERSMGDVYVAWVPAIDSQQFAVDDSIEFDPLQPRPPEVTTFTREAIVPLMYLLTLFLLAMPIDRFIRRRS